MRVVDKDFNVLRVNQTFEALSALKKHEAVGRKCYQIFGGPLCHRPACPLTRILGGEKRVELDAEKERSDGSKVSCIVTATAFCDPSGEIVGIVEDFKDITERKQTEEALRISEQKYRNLVDNALVGVYKTDMDGTVLYVNEAMARTFEFETPEAMMSQNVILRYKNPKDREALINALQKHGRVTNFACESLTRTGKTVHVLLTAVRDEDAISGMIQDVTDLKEAEEALKSERQRLYSVLDGLPAFVCLIAPDYSLRFANRYFRDHFGDPGGRSCYEVLSNHSKPCEECQTFSIFETATPVEWEWTTPQGATYQIYDYPFSDVDGSPLVVELGIDITERKRLEEQLQQAQKMEAIGTLAGGIAHDFNNVLMAIQGHTSLMLLNAHPDDSHFDHLTGVEDMVQKGADLTRQLLGFARGGKYEVRPTDLNELVQKSTEMFGRTKKEVKIHQKLQKGILAVEVDQTQFEQVLLNLYVNAWQAMPHGGDLYVETSDVVLDENDTKPHDVKPGNYVKVSVADTGTGMDKAIQQRIFDPFFTTKEMGRGTGLGLASAYGIIKNHGGIINVYSEKERGTTFTIYLPASERQVTPRQQKAADEILTGTETILLVDDEDEVLDVGQKMLEQMGYKVLLSTNGKQAIDIYLANPDDIDLVILDMIMPGMGGGETYDRMKEVNPDVKVLLSSGYSIDGQASKILDRGCNGFIQKPFGMKELSRELREILDKD